MPGLFGIIRKTARLSPESIRSMTGRMGSAMRTESRLVVEETIREEYGGGRVSSGVLNPEPQPLVAGRHLAWFDGEVYPTPNGSGRAPSGEEIARLIGDSGRALMTLDGVFSLACFDTGTGNLVLATDRLGFRPLYVAETADWFAYASRVRALLAIHERTPSLDRIALGQFFAFDHLLGDRTWWEGIAVMPPGSRWRISPAGRRTLRYWTFDDIPHAPAPADEVIDQMSSLWSRAVRERGKPGLTPLLLSGGLDSRSLLAELRRQDARVTTITFGEPRCPDVLIARRCARIARVPNQSRVITRGTWWTARETGIAQTDGLINALHLHATIAGEALEVGNRVSPIHIAGDSLFGGAYLADYRVPARAAKDWQKAWPEIVARYYQPNPFFTQDEVVTLSSSDVSRYLEGRSPDSFFYLHRQRRFILYGTVALAPHCETTFPGVSLPLIDLLLGKTSPDDRKHNRLHSRFLLARYPELFTAIPWQATGSRLAPRRSGWGRAIGSLLDRLPWRSPARWRRPFIDYNRLVRAIGLPERLRGQSLLVEDALGSAVRGSLVSGSLDARVLLGIVTLEAYLRQVSGVAPLPVTD
jgi:asparagine synthetase B (glutamine-hydrolysing)